MKKSIKLVAFDMDGTVLDSKLRLPKGLFEMIESHPNVKFVVASGRQYYSLLNIFNPIKDKLIFISENVFHLLQAHIHRYVCVPLPAELNRIPL